MRRAAIGGLAVVLMGLSVAAAPPRDDDDAPPKSSAAKANSSWSFRRLIGLDDKAPPKKQPEKTAAKKADAPAPKPVSPAVQLAKKAETERQREVVTWQRREAVILRLEEVALETNDPELQRMADQLRERVWAQYMERIARLPASKATYESDERVLDRHLVPDAGTGRQALTPPRGNMGLGEPSRTAEVEDK